MKGVDIQINGLSKSYEKAGHRVDILDGADLSMAAGESLAVIGASGSGKSTFMQLLGLLDAPGAGTIHFDGRDTASLGATEADRWRNRNIGFIFQSHHLLSDHTALSNVMIPVRLAGGKPEVARTRAERLLTAVGLQERMEHLPAELSGGEQQRVAIARALVMGPRLVLADEPTGNLDPKTAVGVFDLLLELNRQLGSNLIVVTHSMDLASRFPRRLSLVSGRFVEA